MKHTPGPWQVKEHSYTHSESKVRISPYTPRYCLIYGMDHEANACLIAAAPMLLNHLRNLILAIEENIVLTTDHAAYICAKQVLDQARGVKP